jgi:hypothetical protein
MEYVRRGDIPQYGEIRPTSSNPCSGLDFIKRSVRVEPNVTHKIIKVLGIIHTSIYYLINQLRPLYTVKPDGEAFIFISFFVRSVIVAA